MGQHAAANQVRESDDLNSRPTDDVGHHDTRHIHEYELHTANRCHGGSAGCIRPRSGSQRRMKLSFLRQRFDLSQDCRFGNGAGFNQGWRLAMRRVIAWFGFGRQQPSPAVAKAASDRDAAFDLDEFGRLLSSGKPEDLKKIARAMTCPD